MRSGVRGTANAMRWLVSYIKNDKSTSRLDAYGDKIIIVGNGPSAGEFDFDKYARQGYNFVCVNLFAADEERFFSLKPKYYCAIDGLFHNPSDPERFNRLEQFERTVAALERVDWDMTFLSLITQKPFFKNDRIKVQKLTINRYQGNVEWLIRKLYDRNIAGYIVEANVVAAALFFCLSGNASEVGLTGVEYDLLNKLRVSKDNTVYYECEYFYEKRMVNYEKWGKVKKNELHWLIANFSTYFRNYSRLAEYAKMKNIPVYNYTVNSLIDAYEKRDP